MSSRRIEIKLSADVADALQNVRRAESGLQGLGKAPAGPSRGLRQTDSLLKRMGGSLSGLRGQMNTIGRIGLTAIGAGISAGVAIGTAAIIKFGVKMEQTRVRFQTMIGSVDKGNQVLAQLNEFANVTPFTNDEVIQAGQTLLAYGVEVEKLQGMLKTVGDVSAGSGKSFVELSGIIGKVMSKGKAETESLNQMTEAGIPIVKTLAEAYGISAAEVYKMAEKGQLTSDVISAAFTQMTSDGGIFANMMEKQSQTVGGKWSTLVGKLQLLSATIGEKVTPLLSAALQHLISMSDTLVEMVGDGTAVVNWIATVGKIGVSAFAGLLKGINNIKEAGTAAFEIIATNAMAQFYLISGAAKIAVDGIVHSFLGMINGILMSYNWVMAKFGKDGVELMHRPKWLDDMRREGKNDLAVGAGMTKRLFSGEIVSDAMGRAQEKNDKLDDGVAKIHNYLDGLLKESQAPAADKGEAAKIDFPAIAAAAEKEIKDKPAKADKLSVDRLHKIGLYNFGGAKVSSADSQRNKLLERILEKVGNKIEYRLA